MSQTNGAEIPDPARIAQLQTLVPSQPIRPPLPASAGSAAWWVHVVPVG